MIENKKITIRISQYVWGLIKIEKFIGETQSQTIARVFEEYGKLCDGFNNERDEAEGLK